METSGYPGLTFKPEDPFAQAVVNNKRQEFVRVIDNFASMVRFNASLPDIFGDMHLLMMSRIPYLSTPTLAYVLESGRKAEVSARSAAKKSEGTILERSLDYRYLRIELEAGLLQSIITKGFWDPLDKEISQEGATITLDSFEMKLNGAEIILDV